MRKKPEPSNDGTERRLERQRRLRFAFLEGAERQSREAVGRGLTQDELRRVIGRFPGVASER